MKALSKLFLGLVVVVLHQGSNAFSMQQSNQSWGNLYVNSPYLEYAESVAQTSDGGFIVAGYSINNLVSSAGWLRKLNSNGGIVWQNRYEYSGNSSSTIILKKVVTANNGFFVVGSKLTNMNTMQPSSDIFVMRLDNSGNILFQKSYDIGAAIDVFTSADYTVDDGLIISGFSLFGRAFIIKINHSGMTRWQRTVQFFVASTIQTLDGGYLVLGFAALNTIVIKLDLFGHTIWQHIYYSPVYSTPLYLKQGINGDFVIAATSIEGVSILKIDPNGIPIYQKLYKNKYVFGIRSLDVTADGVVLAGYGFNSGLGNVNMVVLKLNNEGGIDWQKVYGNGQISSSASSVQQTSDLGYVLAGSAIITSVSANSCVLKILSDGTVPFNSSSGWAIQDGNYSAVDLDVGFSLINFK
ncbi:MAG: hypothetical protein HY606_01180, partial [Planctomycetes bacterium]|nr:hypothetical protein [Planctomycetota bacterium]